MGLLLARLFTTRTEPFTFWFVLKADTTEIENQFLVNNRFILPEMEPANFAFGIVTTNHQAIRYLKIKFTFISYKL